MALSYVRSWVRDILQGMGTKGGSIIVLLSMHFASYVPYMMQMPGAERPFDLILGALLGVLTDQAIEVHVRGSGGASNAG